MAEMSCRRSGAGVGVIDGLLYAVGGHDGPLVRNTVELYNPETNTWTQVAHMHLCRRNAGERNLYIPICNIPILYIFQSYLPQILCWF